MSPQSFCLAQIARAKAPERWFVVDHIPRNALDKPVRNLAVTTPSKELTPA